MKYLSRALFPFLFLCSIFLISCQSSTNSGPNSSAEILGFEIIELSDVSFSINNEEGFIEVTNLDALEAETDLSSLKPLFTVSEGASLFMDDQPVTSGETELDFSNGLFFTVISEDQSTQKTYFIYLSNDLPLNYLISDTPIVNVNPSGRNPLSAEIVFETRQEATASIEVLGTIPVNNTFETTFGQHKVPVLGLYPDTDNRVVLTVENLEGHAVEDTIIIATTPLPDFLPTPEINILQESKMEPGMHFNEVHIGNAGAFNTHPIIFDNNGDIRWYIDLREHERITWPIQFNNDGSFYAVFGVSIIEYDMLGNELDRIVVEENNMHHEIIKLPNGNYVIAVSRVGTTMIKAGEEITSVEDYIIEVDQSGSILTEWDLAEVLDVNRTELIDGGTDWFHMNAIWYDENDNSLVISGRNQGLVKVNWDNELQWILAPHKGWGKAGRYEKTTETAPYLLTAIDQNGDPYSNEVQQGDLELDSFSWTWGQHAPLILPNGNLFVFDNGTNRNFGTASNYSLGTEYQIDSENMTVTQVWSYGKSRGQELFSNIISDVDYLSQTGNRLFMPGVIRPGSQDSYSKVVELTYPGKEVVFESTLHFKNQLVNGQGWGNIDITYRAERIPSLYP